MPVLPFDKSLKTVLVIGHLAAQANTGDHGSSNVYPPSVVTALDGIREKLSGLTEVIHVEETEIEKIRELAPKAEAVVGNDYNDEGEYVMPDSDIDSTALMAQGYKNNGNPLIAAMLSKAKGSDGGSYTSGYGLSYTKFAYGETGAALDGDAVLVKTSVKNVGERAGDEIVQVYVSVPGSQVERHVKELKGFARVSLAAGEEKAVEIRIPLEELKYYDEATNSWLLEHTAYEFLVGPSSAENDLRSVKLAL